MAKPAQNYPAPLPQTVGRIEGPLDIRGMNVWRVWDVSGEREVQYGPDCFSWEQVASVARDLVSGKKVIYMGQNRMVKKAL